MCRASQSSLFWAFLWLCVWCVISEDGDVTAMLGMSHYTYWPAEGCHILCEDAATIARLSYSSYSVAGAQMWDELSMPAPEHVKPLLLLLESHSAQISPVAVVFWHALQSCMAGNANWGCWVTSSVWLSCYSIADGSLNLPRKGLLCWAHTSKCNGCIWGLGLWWCSFLETPNPTWVLGCMHLAMTWPQSVRSCHDETPKQILTH